MQDTEQQLLHTYNRYQIVLDKGEGVYLYDMDGKEYLDFGSGIGDMAYGYSNQEYKDALKDQIDKVMHVSNLFYSTTIDSAAKRLKKASGMDRVFFTNSGAEAIEGALKAAKKYAYTRDNGSTDHEIIAMNHSFHGRTMGALSVTGTEHYRAPFEQLIPGIRFAEFNDIESVKAQVTDKTCAIIVELLQGEGGIYPATEEFVAGLKELQQEKDILLIFDEVITGFRLSLGGASEYFQIKPDLLTYGKIIGGGMPVGAYGGRKEIMQVVAPAGPVYQAGTLSGNPVAMIAGITQLQILRDHPEIYTELNRLGERFRIGARAAAEEAGISCQITGIGSLSCMYFADQPVRDYDSANRSDTAKFAEYYHKMLEMGNYFGPSQFESVFLSAAHTEADIDKTIEDMKRAFR